ncbi:putative two-component system response regulator [Geminocystis sp. NIES-3708]|uniref:response regulator n=1 Tax=Geminocystis sp. NIES-3708 TaxID=1615909 RepID=UPI0005FCDABF|nr:response regulator [Geminocystis sp. NIES-3708]BAQ61591.1 putative two-component system response regulator [Geminocystis sp. NIES-3708]
MNTTLKPINLFEDLSLSSTTGQLEIRKNAVSWQLSLLDGKLEFATHSLQSGNTLKYYLRSIGYENTVRIDFLTENKTNIKQLIYFLEKDNFINAKQKAIIQKKITEDALESLFWLSKHHNESVLNPEIKPLQWQKNEVINSEYLLEIKPLIKKIEQRWHLWQKLSPTIISPHQRPTCANTSLLEKSVPSGTFSLGVLKQLVKLMHGLSLRELAFFVKQDELKLAQLLSTYIKHGILQLHPPKSPLDLLPQIPQPIPQKLSPNLPTTKKLVPVEQKYTIVCIDDSPAMLEIISSYLDADKYNLTTIPDPMKSLSSLFKSNPDLIIMDVSMPGINGNRLCQILKSSPIFKFVPIILISGETNIKKDILESTGARDFLPKPFNKETLINLIHKYC